jgi:hypothetical protein
MKGAQPMASHFDGMNLREIQGMPMTGEATGLQLAHALNGKRPFGLLQVALRQESYVRSCFLRCSTWRRRKRRQLRGALQYAERVTDINLHLDLHKATP